MYRNCYAKTPLGLQDGSNLRPKIFHIIMMIVSVMKDETMRHLPSNWCNQKSKSECGTLPFAQGYQWAVFCSIQLRVIFSFSFFSHKSLIRTLMYCLAILCFPNPKFDHWISTYTLVLSTVWNAFAILIPCFCMFLRIATTRLTKQCCCRIMWLWKMRWWIIQKTLSVMKNRKFMWINKVAGILTQYL